MQADMEMKRECNENEGILYMPAGERNFTCLETKATSPFPEHFHDSHSKNIHDHKPLANI